MANRVALVTGGNGGIGTEICKQLSAAGYRVEGIRRPTWLVSK